MTNFQGQASSSRLHWLTPERALFFVPVLACVGVSFALLPFTVVPMWSLVRERKAVVQDLSKKSFDLPQLELNLQTQQVLKLQLEDQEDRLIQMLAGTKDLDTFLAGLNQLALQHQVTVVTTEPGAIEVWSPPLEGGDVVDGGLQPDGDLSASGDDLLQEGLEKRSALIQVQGAFRNVQGFLQDLESLEVFVIASELTMEAIRFSAGESVNEGSVEAKLELQLSAYGRAVAPASNEIGLIDEVQP